MERNQNLSYFPNSIGHDSCEGFPNTYVLHENSTSRKRDLQN